MRLKELTKSLASRWYVLLAGLVLTGGMCALVYDRVPATYEASGSLVLMPPSATVGNNGNPYLYLIGMTQALDVLTRQANAAEVRKPILEKFPGTTYSVEADRSTSGAVVLVKATGPSPSATMDQLKAGLDTVPATLKAMQDELSIADYSRINLKTIVVAPEPTRDNKSQLQFIIVTAGLGLVGTVLSARMLDGLLAARRVTRAKPDRPTTGPPDASLRRRERRSGSSRVLDSQPLPPDPAAEELPEPPEKTKVPATIP